MTAIRRYLRDGCGLEQNTVAMTAYWRRAPT
jgi:NADPH-dependent ferric siderophore reductase